MRKLFLASSFSEAASLFPKFAGEEIKGKRITFIPTASLVEEVRFYVDDDRKAFEELGIIVEELEITTASPDKILEVLNRNDYIFVSGGNTFYLLQEL